MRDESIPTVFGRPNIRITQSFLIMFVGVASLIAGGIQEGVEKNDEFRGWIVNLKLGGSFLIIVGVATATLIILHKKGEFKLLEEADVRSSNEYTNTKDKKQSETNGETKHESGDDLPKDNDKTSMPVESEKLHSDDTQTGNYNGHAMANRSENRSTETPNTSSAQAYCETERQEHVHGIPPGQSSFGRMNGNKEEHESDRMKSVYGLSPQRQSSKGMIHKNIADQIHSDASMHQNKSNHFKNEPGFPQIFQGQHPKPYAGSQIMPKNNNLPPNGQPKQGKQVQEKSKRKEGKDKKQKSSNSVIVTEPVYDRNKRTGASVIVTEPVNDRNKRTGASVKVTEPVYDRNKRTSASVIVTEPV